jgi:hypothetical protein
MKEAQVQWIATTKPARDQEVAVQVSNLSSDRRFEGTSTAGSSCQDGATTSASAAPEVDLVVLATAVRTAHAAVAISARHVFEHAMAAGDALLAAKAALPHGQWRQWLDRHCRLSERHAQRYMLLARKRAILETNPTRVADLSVRGALRLLKGQGAPTSTPTRSKLSVAAWSAASPEVRRQFLDEIGLTSLLDAVPPGWRNRIERQFPADVRLTQALRLAMSTEVRGEANAALAAIKRVVERQGYCLHDVALVLRGDVTRNNHRGAA